MKEQGIMGRFDDVTEDGKGLVRGVREERYPSRCHNKSGK